METLDLHTSTHTYIYIFHILAGCIDGAFDKGKHPDGLKITNLTPTYKKVETADKRDFTPVSILLLLSKIFQRLLYDE